MSVKTFWLYGVSGAGKTTIAQAWLKNWQAIGRKVVLLDEETLKQGLNSDLTAASILREEPIRRIAEVAKLFNLLGFDVLVCAVTPLLSQRQLAESILGAKQFLEVFVDAPILICQRRDPKGLYVKALSGRLKYFPGVNAPFERPNNPKLHIETEKCSVTQALAFIFNKL